MKSRSILLYVVFILTACGPSKQEQAAAEKQKMDSVIAATKAQEQARQEDKAALQKQMMELESEAAQLRENLKQNVAALQGEKARLESVESFHLLRTSSEKAAQISQQSLVILNLQEEIENIQIKLTENTAQQTKVKAKIEQY